MVHQGVAQTIELHPQAPRKPPLSAPCNGCGVCCAAEPCPLGRLISRSKSGRCAAVVWSGELRCYECGVVNSPSRYLTWLPSWTAALVVPLLKRWIAAGKGCDSDALVE